MRKQLLLPPAILLLIMLLASCSLQKRHYRPGFYHDRAKKTNMVVEPVDESSHAALPEEELYVVQEKNIPAKDSAAAIAAPQVKKKKPFIEKAYRTFGEAEKQMTSIPAYNKMKERLPQQEAQGDGEKMDFAGISFGFGIFALVGLIGLLFALSGVPGQVSLGGFLLMLASPILALLAVIFGLFGLFDSIATGNGTDKRNAALVFLLALVDLVLLMLILTTLYA